MPQDIDDLRSQLSDSERLVAELKAHNETHRDEMPTKYRPAQPVTAEKLKKRIYWIVVALIAINCISPLKAIVDLIAGPKYATVLIPREQVTVLRYTTGVDEYRVKVPLDDSAFAMKERIQTDFISTSAFSVALLCAVLYSMRQLSHIEGNNSTPQAECSPAAIDNRERKW